MDVILKKSVLFFCISTAIFTFVSCSTMPEGNPDKGERWYRLNRCNGCHGEKGIGGKGIGTKGPSLAGFQLSYGKFIKKVRTPNSGIMPEYTPEILPDQDAADIYSWLKQLKT